MNTPQLSSLNLLPAAALGREPASSKVWRKTRGTQAVAPASWLTHGLLWCLAASALVLGASAAQPVRLETSPAHARLSVGVQAWFFTRVAERWALDHVEADGKAVAEPLSREDSFWLGSGQATQLEVLTNQPGGVVIRFALGTNTATYAATADQPLPAIRVAFVGPATATVVFRTVATETNEHGAWVTRGCVATDMDGHEDFIDASNPFVFGHSQAGGADTCYVFLPVVKEHIQPNGRTEQRSDTWFKSARMDRGEGRFSGSWRLRMGAAEPKKFRLVFDRDLGGRLSDVCEKYYADAVDTLVDITSVPRIEFDPEKCLEVMPVRLAAPDAFIPGWGWMMAEFPRASYPYAHSCVWQQAALLAFEGLASGRAWEHNFARYLLDRTPLEGSDGRSYLVRRPGGLVRWAYFATYRDGFPNLDGGTWWQADLLYRTALALNDSKLRQSALEMVQHDLDVKLDPATMSYPPCWSATTNGTSEDTRDDWFRTPGLAYCAYMAAKVAWPETQSAKYLRLADLIDDWFAGYLGPESKLNYLQGNNMHAVFSHYLTLAFLERFERTRQRLFLDMARDMAWVHIMTSCTTAAKDAWGRPLTGTTCVGVRGCVDYDCAPNLCHEKDLTFVHILGPLLDHVSGPAYAKYIALQRLVLAKDSWKNAWAAELRDTNLRTFYDTYARGMANLIYALNRSTDPWVCAADKLVSKSDTNIVRQRDVVLANPTSQARQTQLQVRFLEPGTYEATVNGALLGSRSHRELAEGVRLFLPPNSLSRVQVRPLRLEPAPPAPAGAYDTSITFLGDLTPLGAQRGTGLPQPIFRKDQSFDGHALGLSGKAQGRGLGCAANTVLVYDLKGEFDRFKALVGVDDEVAARTNPGPSVFFTVFVDGFLRFESGAMTRLTAARQVDVDVRGAQTLMLRMSCNWDDNGNSQNDHGDWAEARLVGRLRSAAR